MAPNVKSAKSKAAGAQKAQAGPSGKMHKFGGAAAQKPGVTATTSQSGKGAPFPKGGPSGKMTGNMKVGTQKPGVSAVTNTTGKSSYAK